MKSVFKKTLASVVAVASIATMASATVSAAAVPTGYVSVALGDVVAKGYAGYVAKDTGAGLYNYTSTSMTTSDILKEIGKVKAGDKDAKYSAYALRSAKYFTVSAGEYEVLAPFIDEIITAINGVELKTGAKLQIASTATDKQKMDAVVALFNSIKDDSADGMQDKAALIGAISVALEDGKNEVVNEAIKTYKENLAKIVTEIKEINPKAVVYVTNLYKPYTGILDNETEKTLLGMPISQLFDLNTILDTYVKKANDNETVNVDIYTLVQKNASASEEAKKDKEYVAYLQADASKSVWEPELTADGYKAVAALVSKDVNGKSTAYDANDDGKVSITDLVLVSKKLSNSESYFVKTANADVDGNKTVNAMDMYSILKEVAK